MKRALKITLLVIASCIGLILITGFGAWIYLKSTFLDFEDDYVENKSIQELTIDGYTFLDRNGNGKLDIYEDDNKSIEARADDLLSQMTLGEKLHLLKGSGIASAAGMVDPGEGIPGAVGTIVPTPRLGIPTVYLSDGPAGLRIQPTREGEDRTYYCTAFPIATMLSSTWNEELVEEVGNAMGTEALEYGLDVILGPGANIHRHPLCGRNFEYFSEDPLLTGNMGAAIVNGIQSNGIGTSVKHYVANNQETNRNFNDVIISDRAMREIYLKAFEIIVQKSNPWTIMSSYNKVNGEYTSESKFLLTDVLRGDWGFEGLVMSDWFGGSDAATMIRSGNDLLEPGTNRQWKALKKAHENGELTDEEIDISTKRILRLILASRKMQNHQFGNNPDLDAHAQITRQSASEGVVMLKNENTLPLQDAMNVALIGVTSYDFIAGGTGSGDVNEAYTISLEKGLINAGYEINQEAKGIYETHKSAYPEEFVKPEGFQAMFNPYLPPQINYNAEQMADIAISADIALITIGRNSGEGGDRVEADDFLLTSQENNMIDLTCKAFNEAGKKVVIVLNIGGVTETASWKSKPDAIIVAWQGGQEGGNSVADILSGKENPSGKLPMTFPVNLNDHASNTNFPLDGEKINPMTMFGDADKPEEEKIKDKDYTLYEEGIYVGYRHFDKANKAVSYPFGFGLSYTEFEYSDIEVTNDNDSIIIILTVKNVGPVPGKEVVQLYMSKSNTSIDRPNQELKAFAKTGSLEPGASEQLSMSFPISALRYWDEEKDNWAFEKGKYEVNVGASSRDIRLVEELEL